MIYVRVLRLCSFLGDLWFFTGQHWPSITLQIPDVRALPGPFNFCQRMFLPASGYNLIILGEDSDSFY